MNFELQKEKFFNTLPHAPILYLFLLFLSDVIFKLANLSTYFSSIKILTIFTGLYFMFLFLSRKKGAYALFLILFFEFVIRLLIIDFSSDGVTYHAPAKMMISEGFNLFFAGAQSIDPRINSFPTLPWILPSILYFITGNVGALTFGTLSLAICLFIYSYYNFSFAKKAPLNLVGAFCIAFSPIFFSQVFTGYQDYFTYALISWAIISFLKLSKDFNFQNSAEFLLIFVCCLTAKYTSFIFSSLIFLPPILFLIFKEKRNFLKTVLGEKRNYLIFGACLFSLVWTYGQNLYYFNGEPFAPATIENNVEFSADNVVYKHAPRYLHFSIQLFSETSLNSETIEIKQPFTFDKKELLALKHSGNRFGASGVLFSGIFLLCIVGILGLKRDQIFDLKFYFIIAISVISFAFPGTWQLRFFPLIQIVPLLMISIGDFHRSYPIKIAIFNYPYFNAKAVILALCFLNITILGFMSSYLQISENWRLREWVNKQNSVVSLKMGGRGKYYSEVFRNLYLEFILDESDGKNCIAITETDKEVRLNNEVLICNHKRN